jgi:biotin carboxyl carrier protein
MKRNKKKEAIEGLATITVDDAVYSTLHNKKYQNRGKYQPIEPNKVKSFMPGTIQEVFVSEGQMLTEGSQLCILEAMKMKNMIIAPIDGIVKKVNVQTGQLVPKNFILIEME